MTELELQDYYYQFSKVTQDDREIFKNTWSQTRPYEFQDLNHTQVTFEFDLNLYTIQRDVYSLLDLIGDVGGLNEGLMLLIGIVIALVNFEKFQHFLIEHLFKK